MPPYELPDNKTQSGIKSRSTLKGDTKTFNEIRFEDKKGKEHVYIHAEKDAFRVVENDDDEKVHNNQTVWIHHNRTEVIKEGDEKLTIEKGNREETLKEGDETFLMEDGDRKQTLTKGDDTLTLQKGDLTVHVLDGAMELQVKKTLGVFVTDGNCGVNIDKGNMFIDVTQGKLDLKSGSDMSIESKTKIVLKCGSSTITLEPTGIKIEGVKIDIKASGALSMEGSGKADLKGRDAQSIRRRDV